VAWRGHQKPAIARMAALVVETGRLAGVGSAFDERAKVHEQENFSPAERWWGGSLPAR